VFKLINFVFEPKKEKGDKAKNLFFLLREMLKYLIILCLIIKTHSWTWNDYPPPRGPDYWRCGVTKPAWICDPDGMLTDQQREEIVELVEDFKEKTKRVRRIFKFYFPANFNFKAKLKVSMYERGS